MEIPDSSLETPLLCGRVVVKIGTSTLCDTFGSPDPNYIQSLAGQIAALRDRQIETVVVSSGAIRAGLDRLTLPHLPRSIPIKQAAAAIGQSRLMNLYAQAFDSRSIEVAQLLLTRDDFHERKRYLHAANTLRALLRLGVVPVVNENDTVAVDEIKVGDNDTLAAQVAAMIDADLLILLSDIDGLYTADPAAAPEATLISRIDDLEAAAAMVSPTRGAYGTGGMATKIEAARIAVHCGIPMVIAHGRSPDVIQGSLRRTQGTLFVAGQQRLNARKRWLAGSKRTLGVVTVHPAAVAQVVHHGKSLLAAGVLDVKGDFQRGDLIALNDLSGITFARGIVGYGNKQLSQIKGLRSDQIVVEGQEETRGEVVHRNDLVLVN